MKAHLASGLGRKELQSLQCGVTNVGGHPRWEQPITVIRKIHWLGRRSESQTDRLLSPSIDSDGAKNHQPHCSAAPDSGGGEEKGRLAGRLSKKTVSAAERSRRVPRLKRYRFPRLHFLRLFRFGLLAFCCQIALLLNQLSARPRRAFLKLSSVERCQGRPRDLQPPSRPRARKRSSCPSSPAAEACDEDVR